MPTERPCAGVRDPGARPEPPRSQQGAPKVPGPAISASLALPSLRGAGQGTEEWPGAGSFRRGTQRGSDLPPSERPPPAASALAIFKYWRPQRRPGPPPPHPIPRDNREGTFWLGPRSCMAPRHNHIQGTLALGGWTHSAPLFASLPCLGVGTQGAPPLPPRPREAPGGWRRGRERVPPGPCRRPKPGWVPRVPHPATPPPGSRRGPAAASLRLARPPAARRGLRNKGWHRGGAGRDLIGSILAFHSSLLCPSEIILTLR